MRFLKQSTSVDVPIGPFLDSTDGVTAETALTITQPDIRLKKNGDAWAQKAAVQTLTHEENGNYEVTLDATDTNTLGLLRLHVAESGALPVWEDFMVMPANVWDSLFGADLLQVDATQLLGTAWAAPATAGLPDVNVKQLSADAGAADNAEAFFDGTGYAGTGNVIPTVTTLTNVADVWTVGTRTLTAFDATFKTGYSLSSAAIQAIWDALTSALTTVGSVGKLLVDNINATISSRFASASAPTNFSVLGINISGHISRTTLVDTTTVNTDMRGTDNAALAATALSTTQWTNARAAYLDVLNTLRVKKNTAIANFEFVLVLSSDHVTGATGKTVTATRSIDGAAFSACTNSVSEVASGIYKISLSAADLNGDVVTLKMTATDCDATFVTFITQA